MHCKHRARITAHCNTRACDTDPRIHHPHAPLKAPHRGSCAPTSLALAPATLCASPRNRAAAHTTSGRLCTATGFPAVSRSDK
eukprot:1263324-Prymnesium_polylepis.1